MFNTELLDDGQQGFTPCVLHLYGMSQSIPLNHSEERGLGLGAPALCVGCFLGFVLVLLPAAEVHLIQLNLSSQCRRIVLMEQCSYLMQNVPSGLLRDGQITGQLMRGYAFLVAADEIDGHEPFLQRQFRVLKDGTYKAGESFMAVPALELIVAIRAGIYMGRAAKRTNYGLAPTLFSDEVPATLVRVEMLHEGDKRVEVIDVKFHSLSVKYYYIL